jgi:hypothetical protein
VYTAGFSAAVDDDGNSFLPRRARHNAELQLKMLLSITLEIHQNANKK